MSWAPSEAKPTVSTIWLGVKYQAPCWDRKSLLTGRSIGSLSRRDIKFGNHTLPGHRGAMRSSRTRSLRTLSYSQNRAIGANEFRRSLGHVCTIASSPGGAGCVRENQSGQWDVSHWRKQIHLCLAELPPYHLYHLGVEPPFPGPQPLSRQDVCSYILDPGMQAARRDNNIHWDHRRIWHASLQSGCDRKPPGDLCRRPPMCCLSGRAHVGPWDLLGNSLELEIQPSSPDNWCAMRDYGSSTDPDLSIPLRSLPSPWERHLSLASCNDMKLPTRDPGTGTKVSSTLPRHISIAV